MEDTSPARSRAASPSPPSTTFPFHIPGGVSTEYLLNKLPSLEEARVYVDNYYKYFGWQ